MRDRVQQLGLEIVRAAKDLSLGRLLTEPGALDREPQLSGRDREKSGVPGPELGRTLAWKDPNRADTLVRRYDRHDARPVIAGRAGLLRADQAYPPRCTAWVHQAQLRACRLQRVTSRIVACRDRGVGQDLGVRFDRHRVQVERGSEVFGDRHECALEIRLGHEKGRFIENFGVVLAVLGLLRARPFPCRERSGDHRSDQEKRQRKELFGVRHDELVGRRHEEPVESQKGQDAGNDRGGPSECDRDNEHGHEVEHRDVGDLGAPDDDADQRGGDSHGANSGDIWDETSHHLTIVHRRATNRRAQPRSRQASRGPRRRS